MYVVSHIEGHRKDECLLLGSVRRLSGRQCGVGHLCALLGCAYGTGFSFLRLHHASASILIIFHVSNSFLSLLLASLRLLISHQDD